MRSASHQPRCLARWGSAAHEVPRVAGEEAEVRVQLRGSGRRMGFAVEPPGFQAHLCGTCRIKHTLRSEGLRPSLRTDPSSCVRFSLSSRNCRLGPAAPSVRSTPCPARCGFSRGGGTTPGALSWSSHLPFYSSTLTSALWALASVHLRWVEFQPPQIHMLRPPPNPSECDLICK